MRAPTHTSRPAHFRAKLHNEHALIRAFLRVTLNALALPRDAQLAFRIAFMALRLCLCLIAPSHGGDRRYAYPTNARRAADRTTRRFVVRSRLDGYPAERCHRFSLPARDGREIP